MEVTVHIDDSNPQGHKLLLELEGKKYARIENPLPSGPLYTTEEVFAELDAKLAEHYGPEYMKERNKLKIKWR